jgi:hypothetical protein
MHAWTVHPSLNRFEALRVCREKRSEPYLAFRALLRLHFKPYILPHHGVIPLGGDGA